ncbi:hypothetical protein BDZ45DRAFT_678817 [Acephala macrosclerotiorum]|nr:hypothetical protein BDZ45DRAFT_678817 [Acephala macrosclerotiorum]
MSTINCLLHPHHVTLGKTHTSIHMLHQHIDDPYYGLDHRPSHEGVSVPKFDVREGADAFYLDGELPGLTHLSEVVCEFIDNQTLIVRGSIKPRLLEGEKLPVATAVKDTTASAPAFTWKLKERHVGKFERSFTFPSKFKSEDMKSSLEFGVLSLVLPKDKDADLVASAKMEIDNEIA